MTIQLATDFTIETDEVYSGEPAFYLYSFNGNITLTNNGTITSASIGINSYVSSGLILNAGTIRVDGTGTTYGLYSPQWCAAVRNTGSIIVSGTDANGMLSWSSGQKFDNQGQISVTGTNNATGLYFVNGTSLTNTGAIDVHAGTGTARGVYIDRIDGGGFENHGTITAVSTDGVSYGLTLSGLSAWTPPTTPNIVNWGVITADIAIYSYSAGYSPPQEIVDYVANHGTINGSISLGLGADTLKNHGTIHGDVSMGVGNDTVDLRVGVFVGEVDLGDGNDTAVGSVSDDVIHGALGRDLIQGGAGGDLLDGGQGNDILYGGVGGDQLLGASGADTLDGGAGADVLTGGTGADRLIGGRGADIFSGARAELAGDVIVDFARGDVINITDVDLAQFTYVRNGATVTLGAGESFTLLNDPHGEFVITADGHGGVNLALAGAAGPETVPNFSADFNGDGVSDLAWRDTAGTFTTWATVLNQGQPTMAANLFLTGDQSNNWQLSAAADFNGDGKTDLLWRDVGGVLDVWTSTGTGFESGAVLDSVSPDWALAATGDFNGDGKADLIWRHSSGTFTEWTSNGSGFNKNVYLQDAVDPSWALAGVGDFDGDGKDDLIWRHSDGVFTEWRSTGAGFEANVVVDGSVTPDWTIAGIGDFNGDGKDDLIWRHDSGAFSEWRSTDGGFEKNVYVQGGVGVDWTLESVGDFNGDGNADLLWRHDGGTFTLWNSTGDGFAQNVLIDSSVGSDWHVAARDYFLA